MMNLRHHPEVSLHYSLSPRQLTIAFALHTVLGVFMKICRINVIISYENDW